MVKLRRSDKHSRFKTKLGKCAPAPFGEIDLSERH